MMSRKRKLPQNPISIFPFANTFSSALRVTVRPSTHAGSPPLQAEPPPATTPAMQVMASPFPPGGAGVVDRPTVLRGLTCDEVQHAHVALAPLTENRPRRLVVVEQGEAP